MYQLANARTPTAQCGSRRANHRDGHYRPAHILRLETDSRHRRDPRQVNSHESQAAGYILPDLQLSRVESEYGRNRRLDGTRTGGDRVSRKPLRIPSGNRYAGPLETKNDPVRFITREAQEQPIWPRDLQHGPREGHYHGDDRRCVGTEMDLGDR
jgi:hypothetical protein